MQKKIIALAIASALTVPAMAFADTSVYGIADAALVNNSTTGFNSRMQVVSGGMSTSRLGVKATEDLGDGMKATANLEYKLDIAGTGSIGAARQQSVGLSGGFGAVNAGFLQDAGYYFEVKFDPTAGSVFDSIASTNPSAYINTGARISSAIDYTSPNMSGLTAQISHSFNNNNAGLVASGAIAGNATTVTVLNVMYDSGPLAAGLAYAADASDNTGFTKTSGLSLGASFDMGVAKLYGTYQTNKVDIPGAKTDKGMALTAVAPIGSDSFVATVGKEKLDSTAASDDKTGITVAYLHNMSKMTTLYGSIAKTTNGGGASIDTTLIGVGLRQKF